MFLLSSDLSRFIKRDSFRCNLNLLLSFKRIFKSLKLASWPFRRMWSKIAGFLRFFTRFLDHILLNDHDASFEDFTILLKESNKFKLQLKESLLIKRDKSELIRNIYSYLWELFDWLFSWFVFSYLRIYLHELIIHDNFHDILSVVDISSLSFENASVERRKRKLILLKIKMNLSKIISNNLFPNYSLMKIKLEQINLIMSGSLPFI